MHFICLKTGQDLSKAIVTMILNDLKEKEDHEIMVFPCTFQSQVVSHFTGIGQGPKPVHI